MKFTKFNFKLSVIVLLLIFTVSCDGYSQNEKGVLENKQVKSVKISKWFNGATFAVSLTWDDRLQSHAKIAKILEEFQYYGSFFPHMGETTAARNVLYDTYHSIAQRGHEVGSHTINHKNLTKLTSDELDYEIVESGKIIEEVTKVKPVSFIHPFNSTIYRVDPIIFDNYLFTRISSPYGIANRFVPGSIKSTTSFKNINQWIQIANNSGRWLVLAGHGIDGYGWEPTTTEILYKTCKTLESYKDSLWVGTLAEVGAYEYLKEELKVNYTVDNSYLNINLAGYDSFKYRDLNKLPISIEVKLKGSNSLDLSKIKGSTIIYRKKNNDYIVSFDLKKMQSIKLKLK